MSIKSFKLIPKTEDFCVVEGKEKLSSQRPDWDQVKVGAAKQLGDFEPVPVSERKFRKIGAESSLKREYVKAGSRGLTKTPSAPLRSQKKGKKGKTGKHEKKVGSKKPKRAKSLHPLISRLCRGFLELNDDSAAIATEFIDPGIIYTFRLSRSFVITSSAGGVMDTVWDNSPSTYAEWSTLTALFDQVKIRRAESRLSSICIPPVGTTASSGSWYPVVFNAIYNYISVAPGSYAAVMDSPNYKVWAYQKDASGRSMDIALNFNGEMEPLWSDVSTPVSADTYAGCVGCFQLYGSAASPITESIYVTQTLTLEFMNRI